LKRWLVTAFEPFGGAQSNSSQLVLNEIRRRTNSGDRVEFLLDVPVSFAQAWPFVAKYLANSSHEYDGILAFGQAEGRKAVSLESVALNWVDARIADNHGLQPPIGPLDENLSVNEVLWSQIPWGKFRSETHKDLVTRSYSAGTYVCNYILFNILLWARHNQKQGGFVHIPMLKSQCGTSGSAMQIDDLAAYEVTEQILEFVVQL